MLVRKITLDEFINAIEKNGHSARFTKGALVCIYNYLNRISDAGDNYIEFKADEIARDFLQTDNLLIIKAASEAEHPIFRGGDSSTVIIHKLRNLHE